MNYIKSIETWAMLRGLDKSSSDKQLIKLVEEVGELAEAHNKEWQDKQIDNFMMMCFNVNLKNVLYRNNLTDFDVDMYTGLKDANGKEIYEDDLVRLTDDLEDPIYKVIFDEAKFEISGGGVCYDLGEEFMDCEIIGDVHTDGDLIDR